MHRNFCHFASGSNCQLLTCCPPVYLQEQASWVCRCEDRVVQRLEQDFKLTLQQQNSLEQWAAWLDGVVSQVLKPYQHSPAFPKAAKLFLLKWSFYRSDVKNNSYFLFSGHLLGYTADILLYFIVGHKTKTQKQFEDAIK